VAQPLFGPIALPLDELARQSDQRPHAPQGAQAFHRPTDIRIIEENGAGEAIRTPDPNLGKLPSRLFYAFRFYAKMPSNI
tara:strand:+ start:140 stop:379 length:240 start_codon:yes stop_codon:yes gene_type:complete